MGKTIKKFAIKLREIAIEASSIPLFLILFVIAMINGGALWLFELLGLVDDSTI